MSIPIDLRPYIGRQEIRRSLKTGSISIAMQRARLGELAQLKTTSLKQDGAIWYLDIDGELKTEHSKL